MSNCTDFGCLWYSNNYKKDTSLKDVLGDKFLIGVAQNTRQSSGVDTASVKIVKQHFNAVGHSQLAQWFCVDKDGKNVSPEILQQRMKNHINEVYS